MKIQFITIDKRMACKGKITFVQEPLFSLEPNSFVVQIGDGRETGCYRTDEFQKPFKYVGSFVHEKVKYFAFQVPPSLLKTTTIKHYLLYETTGLELLSRTKSYVRFFSPKFKTTQLDLFN